MNAKPALCALRLLLALVSTTVPASYAQTSDPQELAYDHSGGELRVLIWGLRSGNESRPAIVLFHGGGWKKGQPEQFTQMCRTIIQYRVVCIAPEFGGTNPIPQASAAVAWVRDHAASLGINPSRIAAGGTSVGGFLAASTAILPSQRSRASVPDALVLLNPILLPFGRGPAIVLKDHIRGALPPTIILHGTLDQTAPFARTQDFIAAAKAAGTSKIELIAYPGRAHKFWNYRGGSNPDFQTAAGHILDFLASLNWIRCRTSFGRSASPGFPEAYNHVDCAAP